MKRAPFQSLGQLNALLQRIALVQPDSLWRHKRTGVEYRVINVVRRTDSGVIAVIYRKATDPTATIFDRTLDEFTGDEKRTSRGAGWVYEPRFEFIGGLPEIKVPRKKCRHCGKAIHAGDCRRFPVFTKPGAGIGVR